MEKREKEEEQVKLCGVRVGISMPRRLLECQARLRCSMFEFSRREASGHCGYCGLKIHCEISGKSHWI